MSETGHSRRLRPLRHRSALPPIADLIADIPGRLLRARRRPEQVQQTHAYSIASSARARSLSGMVTPSALAVVRLITRWNLVGCSIGISPGLLPCKILSASSAARRYRSGTLGP